MMERIIVGRQYGNKNSDGKAYTSLSQIATSYGYPGPQEIFDFEHNALLRGKNETRDFELHGVVYTDRTISKIYEGDEVFLPPKEVYEWTENGLHLALKDEESESSDVVRITNAFPVNFTYAGASNDSSIVNIPSGWGHVIYWLYDENEEHVASTVDWAGVKRLLPQGFALHRQGSLTYQTVLPKYAFENVNLENKSFYCPPYYPKPYHLGKIEVARSFSEVLPYVDLLQPIKSKAMRKDFEEKFNLFGMREADPTIYHQESDAYLEKFTLRKRESLKEVYYHTYPRLVSKIYDEDIWKVHRYPYLKRRASYWERNDAHYKASTGDYAKCTSPGFFKNRTYGFLLLPPEMGPYQTKRFVDLAKTPVREYLEGNKYNELSHFVATKVKIDDTNIENGMVSIQLHCTLSEWDLRLRKQLASLKRAQINLEEVIKDATKRLNFLGNMDNLLKLFSYQNPTFQDNHNVKGKLRDINREIYKELIEKGATSSSWKWVNREAGNLWALLQTKELSSEIKHYCFHYIEQCEAAGEDKSPAYLTGPYTYYEPNWSQVFRTIGLCYEALSKTTYHEKILDSHISESLSGLCALGGKLSDQEKQDLGVLFQGNKLNDFMGQIDEVIKEETDAYEEKTKDKSVQNPFLAVLSVLQDFFNETKARSDFLSPILYKAMGPDSLFTAMIRHFEPSIMRKFYKVTLKKLNGGKPYLILRGLLRLTTLNWKDSINRHQILLNLIKEVNQGAPKSFDQDSFWKVFCHEKLSTKPGRVVVRSFRGFIAFLNLFGLFQYAFVSKDWKGLFIDKPLDRVTAREIAQLVYNYAGLGNTMAGSLASGIYFAESLGRTIPWADAFGRFLGGLSIVVGLIQCGLGTIQILSNDKQNGINNLLTGGAGIAFGLSAMVVSASATSAIGSWITGGILASIGATGVGIILVVIAVALLVLAQYFQDAPSVKKAEELMLKWWEDFLPRAKGSSRYPLTLVKRYEHAGDVEEYIQELDKKKDEPHGFGISWGNLSWKAIIPFAIEEFPLQIIKEVYSGSDFPYSDYSAEMLLKYYTRLLKDPSQKGKNIMVKGRVLYDATLKTWRIRNFDDFRKILFDFDRPDGAEKNLGRFFDYYKDYLKYISYTEREHEVNYQTLKLMVEAAIKSSKPLQNNLLNPIYPLSYYFYTNERKAKLLQEGKFQLNLPAYLTLQ